MSSAGAIRERTAVLAAELSWLQPGWMPNQPLHCAAPPATAAHRRGCIGQSSVVLQQRVPPKLLSKAQVNALLAPDQGSSHLRE